MVSRLSCGMWVIQGKLLKTSVKDGLGSRFVWYTINSYFLVVICAKLNLWKSACSVDVHESIHVICLYLSAKYVRCFLPVRVDTISPLYDYVSCHSYCQQYEHPTEKYCRAPCIHVSISCHWLSLAVSLLLTYGHDIVFYFYPYFSLTIRGTLTIWMSV